MTDAVMTEPVGLFERASQHAQAVMTKVTTAQLSAPTPCSEWKVRDLLNHVIGGGHMFTAGLRGQGMGAGAPPDFVSQAGHTRAYHDAIDGFMVRNPARAFTFEVPRA